MMREMFRFNINLLSHFGFLKKIFYLKKNILFITMSFPHKIEELKNDLVEKIHIRIFKNNIQFSIDFVSFLRVFSMNILQNEFISGIMFLTKFNHENATNFAHIFFNFAKQIASMYIPLFMVVFGLKSYPK